MIIQYLNFYVKGGLIQLKQKEMTLMRQHRDRRDTAVISQEIRYYTAIRAMEFCLEFLDMKQGTNNLLISPKFIKKRKVKMKK